MNDQEAEDKSGARKLSPISVYRLLPKTNCKKCGEANCMALAAKLVNRDVTPEKCLPLLKSENEETLKQLKELLRPVVREVLIGVGEKAVRIGGKLVMYRHEFAYTNPTAIAIDVTDEMPDNELLPRVKKTENFAFEYIGQKLKLDLIAVRSTSNDPERFRATVKKVSTNTKLPLILCSFIPTVLEAGLTAAPGSRPLLYAATKDNWKQLADLARTHGCPLAVFAPGDADLLRSLTKALVDYGVEDLALDPGTLTGEGLAATLHRFTMLRQAACKRGDTFAGFPLLALPMAAWFERGNLPEEVVKWREAYLMDMVIVRFADIMIVHNTDGWALLPPVVLRQNLYTDPRKPAAVEPSLQTFGTPDEDSPVMFTTNFALTYYTVASDIENAKTDAYLLIVDTGGIAVDSAVAGRKLTAEKVVNALKASGVEGKVKHRKLIIPGKSARLSGEIEEQSGWQVIVGPKDSSDIPEFLREKWKKQA